MELWIIFIATTIVAGIVRGFTGFGGALVMAPVFMTRVDPVTATTAILIVNTIVGLVNFREVGAETDWGIARPLALAGCIATPIGLWLVTQIDVDLVRRIVAFVVLVASIGLALRWRFPFSIRSRMGNALLGSTSGSLFGLGGVGGPPVIIGMLAEDLPARVTRATLLTYFTLVQSFTFLLMVFASLVGGRGILFGAALVPAYYLGSELGLRLLTPARALLFRRISITLLVVIASYAMLPLA